MHKARHAFFIGSGYHSTKLVLHVLLIRVGSCQNSPKGKPRVLTRVVLVRIYDQVDHRSGWLSTQLEEVSPVRGLPHRSFGLDPSVAGFSVLQLHRLLGVSVEVEKMQRKRPLFFFAQVKADLSQELHVGAAEGERISGGDWQIELMLWWDHAHKGLEAFTGRVEDGQIPTINVSELQGCVLPSPSRN